MWIYLAQISKLGTDVSLNQLQLCSTLVPSTTKSDRFFDHDIFCLLISLSDSWRSACPHSAASIVKGCGLAESYFQKIGFLNSIIYYSHFVIFAVSLQYRNSINGWIYKNHNFNLGKESIFEVNFSKEHAVQKWRKNKNADFLGFSIRHHEGIEACFWDREQDA